MKSKRTILAAATLLSLAFHAQAQSGLKICLLYCPVDYAGTSCKMSWHTDGGCSCECKGLSADTVEAISSKERTAEPMNNPVLSLRLDRVDDETISLVPTTRAGGVLEIPGVNSMHVNDGGGDAAPAEPPEKPLTPKEVVDLLDEIVRTCKLRGGC